MFFSSLPLNIYPSSQLHLAYKLSGAISHVITFVPAANDGVEYHQLKTKWPFLFGVQSCLIVSPSTKIIAPVHPFEYTFIDGETK